MKKNAALACALALLVGAATVPAAQEKAAGRMGKIAESNRLELYLDKESAALRVVGKASGQYMDTKIMDGQKGNESTLNNQKSDLVFNYISDLKSAAVKSADTYSLSVDKESVVYEPIEQGVRIRYHIGETKTTIHDFPQYTSVEKMEGILSKLDNKQKKTVEEFYRRQDDRYVRTKNDNVSDLKIKQYYELIYETGGYTAEDLQADNAAYGEVSENVQVSIDASIEYTLEDGDLVVRVPAGEIMTHENFPMQSIDFLPYFLTGTQQQEGYLFVPDGSGALIRLNNNKQAAVSYSEPVYGEDLLKDAGKYQREKIPVSLPVFGVKAGGLAVLGIIEEGDALAQINAEISGKSDEFNRVGLRFNLRPVERIAALDNSTVTQPRWAQQAYQGDLTVRYRFLEDGQADYSGMALAYRDYLREAGTLEKTALEDSAPLFVEFLGAAYRRELFMGVSYDAMTPLTTFSQAEEILRSLADAGAGNIKAQFTGWMSDGISHQSLEKIGVQRSLGSRGALHDLMRYAEQSGVGFYPTARLMSFDGGSHFNTRRNSARQMSGDIAYRNEMFDPLMVTDASAFTVSPNYLPEYAARARGQLDKNGIQGVAVADAGEILFADYSKKREATRQAAKTAAQAALAELSGGGKLMIAGANAYALGSARYAVDLPMTSNRYKVFDEDIPFLQMVLDSSIPYAGEALNQHPEADPREQLLRCVESRTSPKFHLAHAGEDALVYSQLELFSICYGNLSGSIRQMYEDYNRFYQQVRGGEMIRHETAAPGVRRVTYSNGAEVLVNYNDLPVTVEGTEVGAMDYKVSQGKG